jgi:hypothetical protein
MNYPVYLYKTTSNNQPDIYLEDEDTLIWAGIGGEVTLSVKDIRRWIKRIDSLKKRETSHD